MDDATFERLVIEGIDAIPENFHRKLENVAIVIADEPTLAQQKEMEVDRGHTLFGLYEGVPQTERGSEYGMVLPDKITIFKNPILEFSDDPEVVRQEVADTVWHEIGHHFGLDEAEVAKREEERRLERTNDAKESRD
jgi:predicted Zn-dependent protease with MMP-like domain